MAGLHRTEKGGLVFSNRIDVGAVCEEQGDGGDVVPEGGCPQAMIRIRAALQQMLGEVKILTSGDCVPQWCRLPVMFAERLFVDIYPGAQEYVRRANALARRQPLLAHIDAAADVKEVP